jgi:cation:H+ antiporter
VTILFYAGVFLASVIITLAGCHLFTNGIEWLGKRLNISEGAVGSVFAAVGTTLPETSIPIIAIFFGAGREQAEVGLGAILGAPFMLSTLVLPILAFLLLLYARIGKRAATFKLNYGDVRVDVIFFLIAYVLALTCAVIPSRMFHAAVAIVLIGLYVYYMKLKFAADDEGSEESVGGDALEPLLFARKSPRPSYIVIAAQGLVGLLGLVGGAHLFVTAANSISAEMQVSPLILALLIAPLATELPEMSNSFLWLYRKKDRLAVGNVTGAMVFQGMVPVSVGLLGTEWVLGTTALATMVLAVFAMGVNLLQVLWSGQWRPWLLSASAILYLGYTLFLYTHGS